MSESTKRRLRMQILDHTVDTDTGTTLGALLAAHGDSKQAEQPIAAYYHNEVRSLSAPALTAGQVTPITRRDPAGQKIYQRSLSYALGLAGFEVLRGVRVVVGHSLGNAFYYSFVDDPNTNKPSQSTAANIDALRERLERIVAEDRPIERASLGWAEAQQLFEERGMMNSSLLVSRHNYAEIKVYRCGNYFQLAHGTLVPSTGYLDVWEIEPYEDGFLLVFPTALDPTTPSSGARSQMLFETYREYKEWGRVLGVSAVGELNRRSESGEIGDFIRVSETLQRRRIAQVADRILDTGADQKVVLVAGPSSSGKTTFSKKLALQLTAMGFIPIVISLDDYFVARERTPRDHNGNYDFEQLEAIDIALLNDHLVELFAGGEVDVPRFNFKTGQPEYHGHSLRIPDRGILLMEGIHGLNPRLTPRVPHDRTFRVYTSALTQLNLDDHTRISTTDNRLIRRMVRDHQFRGHSAEATLGMWASVRRGEDHNIFPFQDSADAAFNSALDYELSVLRTWAEPLLRGVKPTSSHFAEAARLQTFLRNFSTIHDRHVPDDSILREFIGGSSFSY